MSSMGRSQEHGDSFGWLVERGAGGDVKIVATEAEMSYGSVHLKSIMPTSDPLRNHSQRTQGFSAVDPALYNFLGRFHQDKLHRKSQMRQ